MWNSTPCEGLCFANRHSLKIAPIWCPNTQNTKESKADEPWHETCIIQEAKQTLLYNTTGVHYKRRELGASLQPRQLARRWQTHLFYQTVQLNQNHNMFYKTVHCTWTQPSAIQLQYILKTCKMHKNTPENALTAIFQHSWTQIILLLFSTLQSVTVTITTSKTLTQGQSSFFKASCHVTFR